VEILMIVVGINIALWFEGWFDEFQDIETEQLYLVGLRDDLIVDLKSLDLNIESNQAKIKQVEAIFPALGDLVQRPGSEQAEAIFALPSYYFFQPSDFTYRSMQDSGDFKLLRDNDLKRDILRLARRYRQILEQQENFLQAIDDQYIPIMMSGFDIIESRITNPAMVHNQIFINFFAFTLQDTQSRIGSMTRAREQAAALLTTIEGQIQ
jgi:hypothetical protein